MNYHIIIENFKGSTFSFKPGRGFYTQVTYANNIANFEVPSKHLINGEFGAIACFIDNPSFVAFGKILRNGTDIMNDNDDYTVTETTTFELVPEQGWTEDEPRWFLKFEFEPAHVPIVLEATNNHNDNDYDEEEKEAMAAENHLAKVYDATRLLTYLRDKYYDKREHPTDPNEIELRQNNISTKDFWVLVNKDDEAGTIKAKNYQKFIKSDSPYLKIKTEKGTTSVKYIYGRLTYNIANIEPVLKKCTKDPNRRQLYECNICKSTKITTDLAPFHCLYTHNGGRQCQYCPFIGFGYTFYKQHTCVMGYCYVFVDNEVKMEYGHAHYRTLCQKRRK